MRGARYRGAPFDELQSYDDPGMTYRASSVMKVASDNFIPPQKQSVDPNLHSIWRNEMSDRLGILAPLRPTFRGLERMTFNVGYACIGGFATGTLLGLAKVAPHSLQSIQMNESPWTVLKRTFRVAREEGAHGLRRWGSIVTIHSMVEAAARYMLWNSAHANDAAPEPVMVMDDMDPRQVMQMNIKEPARRVMPEYDVENMEGNTGPLKYSFFRQVTRPSWPPEDPRVLPVWTAFPVVMARAWFMRNTVHRGALAASCVLYPAAVYLWQSRMPPDTYMDLAEEYVPDESMGAM